MQHGFAQVGLPGCVTCHSNHKILPPGDQMLGVAPPEVCSRCHGAGAAKGPNAAMLAGFDMKRIIHGGEVATTLRQDLETLKRQIGDADARLEKAERLGMLVPGPQSNPRLDPRIFLRKANDTLTNARVEIHSFDARAGGEDHRPRRVDCQRSAGQPIGRSRPTTSGGSGRRPRWCPSPCLSSCCCSISGKCPARRVGRAGSSRSEPRHFSGEFSGGARCARPNPPFHWPPSDSQPSDFDSPGRFCYRLLLGMPPIAENPPNARMRGK